MARHRQAHRGKRRRRDGALLWQPTERYEGCDRTRDSGLLLRGWRRSAHEIRIAVLVWRKPVPRDQRLGSGAREVPAAVSYCPCSRPQRTAQENFSGSRGSESPATHCGRRTEEEHRDIIILVHELSSRVAVLLSGGKGQDWTDDGGGGYQRLVLCRWRQTADSSRLSALGMTRLSIAL